AMCHPNELAQDESALRGLGQFSPPREVVGQASDRLLKLASFVLRRADPFLWCAEHRPKPFITSKYSDAGLWFGFETPAVECGRRIQCLLTDRPPERTRFRFASIVDNVLDEIIEVFSKLRTEAIEPSLKRRNDRLDRRLGTNEVILPQAPCE